MAAAKIFSEIQEEFGNPEWRGISERAKIHHTARLSPFCVIEDEVQIAEGALIGPNTYIRDGTKIGKRSIVGPLCSIEGNGVVIGNDVTIRSQSNIMWKMTIEDKVFISGGFYAANDKRISKWIGQFWEAPECKIGFGARIGIGVLLGPDCDIGKCSLVGFGSVITRSIPDYEIWYGSPAKKHGVVPLAERFDNS